MEMGSESDRNSSAALTTPEFPVPQAGIHSPSNPPVIESTTHANMTDSGENSAAVANGVRSSPSPNIPSVPNGKPASPYVKESNPVANVVQTVSSKDPKAAAAAANDMRNVVRRKLTGYVGFANLPNQWHRKSVRKGFNFNVMVVGTYKHSGKYYIRTLISCR